MRIRQAFKILSGYGPLRSASWSRAKTRKRQYERQHGQNERIRRHKDRLVKNYCEMLGYDWPHDGKHYL